MDPLTHTFVGTSLSAAGLRRATPLATTTLVLGANAPDVDIVAQLFGPYAGLAWRRGITHGIPALVVLPLVLAGLVLAWDRWVRRRARPDAAHVRPLPLLGLAYLGVWTHPALDWLNTYGMRWWLPFDGSWSYGDAVFIVDPWLWLLLGGATFLAFSRTPLSWAAWGALALSLSVLVMGTSVAPMAVKVLWIGALVGLVGLRLRTGRRAPDARNDGETRDVPGVRDAHDIRRERMVSGCVAAAAVYILLMVGQTAWSERTTLAEARELGMEPVNAMMVGPVPGNPFRADVILRTAEGYHRGSFHWMRTPRLQLEPDLLPGPSSDPVVRAAARHPDARNFLTWSRFPLVTVTADGEGWAVRFQDVRYMGQGALGGPTIHVPPDSLNPREEQ